MQLESSSSTANAERTGVSVAARGGWASSGIGFKDLDTHGKLGLEDIFVSLVHEPGSEARRHELQPSRRLARSTSSRCTASTRTLHDEPDRAGDHHLALFRGVRQRRSDRA